MKELSREEKFKEILDNSIYTGTKLSFEQYVECMEHLESLLTPIPEDKLEELIGKTICEIGKRCYRDKCGDLEFDEEEAEDDLRQAFKEYESMRGGKE